MEILNVRVNGLEESIIAASYPMLEKPLNEEEFKNISRTLKFWIFDNGEEIGNILERTKGIKIKDLTCEQASGDDTFYDSYVLEGLKVALTYIRRAISLGKTNNSEGHSCYLKGVNSSFDMKAPEWFWRQWDRYHFSDYVSSMSKMHRITKIDLEENCNNFVCRAVIEELKEYIDMYNNYDVYLSELGIEELTLRDFTSIPFTKENIFKFIVNNVPAGFELTARVETNYLQEKSKYFQRKNHKMYAWKDIYCPFLETLPLFKELCGIE